MTCQELNPAGEVNIVPLYPQATNLLWSHMTDFKSSFVPVDGIRAQISANSEWTISPPSPTATNTDSLLVTLFRLSKDGGVLWNKPVDAIPTAVNILESLPTTTKVSLKF